MKKFIAPFKYMLVLVLFVMSYVAFNNHGWFTFLPVIASFLLIPLLELLFKPDASNLSSTEEEMIRDDAIYDALLYVMVPAQVVFLFMFLQSMTEPNLSTVDIIGRISSMGMLCGVIGINVAHELGHRSKRYEQFLAKILLLSSLYMHFFIEHNRGHHKKVSTPEDPASSRKGENIYSFWIRSIRDSYLSAWKLEFERLKLKGNYKFTLYNEMINFQFIQLAMIVSIGFFYGINIMLYFFSLLLWAFCC